MKRKSIICLMTAVLVAAAGAAFAQTGGSWTGA
jgi:hypothetical protein